MHVSNSASENKLEEIIQSFSPYISKTNEIGILNETYIAYGNLTEGVKTAVAQFRLISLLPERMVKKVFFNMYLVLKFLI